MSDLCVLAATLRHNIELPSDVQLAIREFKHLTRGADVRLLRTKRDLLETPFSSLPKPQRARVEKMVRSGDPIGLVAMTPPAEVIRVVTRASFLQDIAVDTPKPDVFLSSALYHRHGKTLLSAVPLRALCEYSSQLFDVPVSNPALRLDGLLRYILCNDGSGHEAAFAGALRSKKTTLALSHDLHIYKAKFFPRMVGALLNVFGGDSDLVLDPFSGSGTALLEAAIVGQPSVGLDVDPLSTLISDNKVRPFTRDVARTRHELRAVIDALNSDLPILRKGTRKGPSPLPEELRGKLARRDAREGTAFLQEIEDDLHALTAVRDARRGSTPSLLEVLLSDAVTKKIRYRFVGVGNGRYTIEVITQRITERFEQKVSSILALCDVFDWLQTRCGVQFGESGAVQGTATTLSALPSGTRIGACVTSPPYLPASSGREHYASSRQLALELTRMANTWDESHFVGTVNAARRAKFDPRALPPTARGLLDYLGSDTERSDPQRDAMRFERKAIPTWQYLQDIEAFLGSLRQRVTTGTPCMMVVASQHTFYSHRRLQEAKLSGSGADAIEYVAECAPLYGELAERNGWTFAEELRMELVKSATSMARPRASDDYYESVLVLRAS